MTVATAEEQVVMHRSMEVVAEAETTTTTRMSDCKSAHGTNQSTVIVYARVLLHSSLSLGLRAHLIHKLVPYLRICTQ